MLKNTSYNLKHTCEMLKNTSYNLKRRERLKNVGKE